jgi:tRNA (cmo5U34)-methyltransferase
MTTILLEEHAPENARILVLGAGGGIELKTFACVHAKWTFLGVDPSAEMLKLAKQTRGSLISQVSLLQGYIEDAPEELFDGTTCLLAFHFLTEDVRRKTLAEVRRRLRPGAPFVLAHLSFPQKEGERTLWLSRYAAFAVPSGVDPRELEALQPQLISSSASLRRNRMNFYSVRPDSLVFVCSTQV